MNDTITLYEKCDHGRLEEHPFGDLCPMNPGCDCICPGGRERTYQDGDTWNCDWAYGGIPKIGLALVCPGGRERTYRQVPWDYFFDSRDKVWVEVPVLEEKEAEPDAE